MVIHIMNIKSINLNLLVILEALLIERNVSCAAEKVFLSQPAVSHALNKLREIFKDKLLVKSGHNMQLTAFAASIQKELHLTLIQLTNLVNKNEAFDIATAEREFHIGTVSSTTAEFIPPLINYLASINSKTKIFITQLDYGQPIDELLRTSKVELVITASNKNFPQINYEKLLTDKYVCLTSMKHPIVCQPKNLKNYLHYPHVSVENTKELSITQRALNKLNIHRNVQLVLEHYLSLPLILPHTELIATISSRLATRFLQHEQLALWKCPIQLPKIDYYLAWHKNSEYNSGNQWLRKFFIKQAFNK